MITRLFWKLLYARLKQVCSSFQNIDPQTKKPWKPLQYVLVVWSETGWPAAFFSLIQHSLSSPLSTSYGFSSIRLLSSNLPFSLELLPSRSLSLFLCPSPSLPPSLQINHLTTFQKTISHPSLPLKVESVIPTCKTELDFSDRAIKLGDRMRDKYEAE